MALLTLADGQVAASAGTIHTVTSTNEGRVGMTFHNTGSNSETVVVTLSRAGGTARRIARAVLAANEALVVTGFPVQAGDVIAAATTNASAADYVVTACSESVPLDIYTLSGNGARKLVRTEATRTIQIGTRGKVGATSGWTVGAANDLPYLGTVAASQTGATLVLPIDGLAVGDTITGFRVVAQIESGGNTVTLDAALRATTNVAAEPTDASIGSMTQVSVTADTAVSQSKTGLTEVVTSGKTYYLLLTATTAGSTDIILQACEITYTTA